MNKLLEIAARAFNHRKPTDPNSTEAVVERFHRLYYYAGGTGGTHDNTFWLGIKTLKCPLDLWVYQEIVFELKPDVIIETGTRHRGSAFFLASICDLLGQGRVITIDIEPDNGRPTHRRIHYIKGSSIADATVAMVRREIAGSQTILAVLDSKHSKAHVLEELRIYSEFVTPGAYLIVEDTNVNGHPVVQEYGPGPMEAVEEFLKTRPDFTVDQAKEKYYLTYNPRGYLRKGKGPYESRPGVAFTASAV